MPPRLPFSGSQSFISFYAASRSQPCRSHLSSRTFHCRSLYASEKRNRPAASAATIGKTVRYPSTGTNKSLTRLVQRLFHASSAASAAAKDPYGVLGVGKDATAAEIKKIYFSVRLLVMLFGKQTETLCPACAQVSPRYKPR